MKDFDEFDDYFSRDDEGGGLLAIIVMALGAMASVGIVWALLWVYTATGPNCPGMDPAHIGWCEE